MSREVVRETFKTELESFVTANLSPAFVFWDTINKNDDVTDENFITCEFVSNQVDNLCYNGDSRGFGGTVDVLVFTRAGRGDALAIMAADAIEDHFNQFAANGVEVLSTISASEQTLGDINKWYGVTLSLNYIYYQ